MTTCYRVTCEHPGAAEHVADITDRRPAGGIEVTTFRDHGTRAHDRNKLGSRRVHRLRCDVCRLDVELADTSMAAALDMLAPHAEKLDTATVPTEVPNVDPDDLLDVLTAGRPDWLTVGHHRRSTVALSVLSGIASRLRPRR